MAPVKLAETRPGGAAEPPSPRATTEALEEFLELTEFMAKVFRSAESRGLVDAAEKEAFVHMMAERLVPRAYADAQVVMRKGDDADDMCFIFAGEAEVFLENPADMVQSGDLLGGSEREVERGEARVQPVNRLGPQEYFGEGAMIGEDGGVRNACVIASGPLDVYLLTREALRACLAAHPSIRTIFAVEREQKEAANEEAARQRAAAVALISRGFFMQVCGNCWTLTARPNMLLQFSNNDAAAAAALTSVISSSGSVLEFLFGPLVK